MRWGHINNIPWQLSHYCFKYNIICKWDIFDDGTSTFGKQFTVLVMGCIEIMQQLGQIVINGIVFCFVFSCLYSQTRFQPHNWRGIWIKDYQCRWKVSKATDMGHSRTGEIQVKLKILLKWFNYTVLMSPVIYSSRMYDCWWISYVDCWLCLYSHVTSWTNYDDVRYSRSYVLNSNWILIG